MNNLLLPLLLIFSPIGNSDELPILPNKQFSPGDVNPNVSLTQLCIPNYTKGLDENGNKVRNVPENIKKKVFEEYHLNPNQSKFD